MSQPYQVLLVEDDWSIARTLTLGLPYKGFEVTACDTVQQGLALIRTRSFDLLLLDLNLPDGSGMDLCKQIRVQDANLPILMVTARTDESSAVLGFQNGADDYVRKPYGLQELAARMQRLLEKRPKMTSACTQGPLTLDVSTRVASLNHVPLQMSKREFDILLAMVRKSGAVITRDEILKALDEQEIYDRTLDSHISHLRRKLKGAGGGIQISAIYGVGYKLE